MLKFNASDSSQGNAEPSMYVYLVVSVEEFTNSVIQIHVIEGKTLTALIVFAFALIAVVFITFG